MLALINKSVIYSITLIAIFVAISVIIYTFKTPTNNKNWAIGNSKAASIEINDDQVVINHFRDADWSQLDVASLKNDDSLYKTLEFQLQDIESVHAVVSHFTVLSGIAHIFIFFELKDKTMIGLSVEARRERGQEYSLSGGLSAQFELIYITASYRDLVGLRLMRDEFVHRYRTKASPEEAQSLFKEVALRSNQIHQQPELYHLFLKNCTTEIVDLVNKIADEDFSRITQSFSPGHSAKALYKMGLLDTSLDFEELQKQSLIKK